jgi:hypothetical protein
MSQTFKAAFHDPPSKVVGLIDTDGTSRPFVAEAFFNQWTHFVLITERQATRLARIGQPNDAPNLWHRREWMAEEIPFNTVQRTWDYPTSDHHAAETSASSLPQ